MPDHDYPTVTVHPLMWADEHDRPNDTYVAAVFATEEGLREYVADVALQGVTIVGAHQHPPVQLHGALPATPAPDVEAAARTLHELTRGRARPNATWPSLHAHEAGDVRSTTRAVLAVALGVAMPVPSSNGNAPHAPTHVVSDVDGDDLVGAVLEAAARAAFETRAGTDADAWDRLDPGERVTWREIAEAAINAYREATR